MNRILTRYYITLHAFSRNIDFKIKKTGPKNQKKSEQISRFSSFRLGPLYSTGIKIGSKWPQHVLKHAEMQSETRGVQGFRSQCGQIFGWIRNFSAPFGVKSRGLRFLLFTLHLFVLPVFIFPELISLNSTALCIPSMKQLIFLKKSNYFTLKKLANASFVMELYLNEKRTKMEMKFKHCRKRIQLKCGTFRSVKKT